MPEVLLRLLYIRGGFDLEYRQAQEPCQVRAVENAGDFFCCNLLWGRELRWIDMALEVGKASRN